MSLHFRKLPFSKFLTKQVLDVHSEKVWLILDSNKGKIPLPKLVYQPSSGVVCGHVDSCTITSQYHQLLTPALNWTSLSFSLVSRISRKEVMLTVCWIIGYFTTPFQAHRLYSVGWGGKATMSGEKLEGFETYSRGFWKHCSHFGLLWPIITYGGNYFSYTR
jgi:hypothetical protein